MAIIITPAGILQGEITLIQAGLLNPEIDICGVTVPLEAVVVGEPFGNAFLWEQLSGPVVTIDDPTAIVTFFTQAGGGDKVFRFWINKGDANQQFDDLLVSDTPQSHQSTFTLPNGIGNTITGPVAFPVTTINGSVVNTPDPPVQDHGEGVVNSVFTLTWEHPGQDNDAYITQYNVIENTVPAASVPASPLSPTASGVAPSGPPSDPRSYDLGAITSYEVYSLYNFHGFTEVAQSAVFDFSSLVVDPVIAIDDGQEGVSLPGGVGLSITRFQNVALPVPNDDAESFSLPSSVSFSVTRYSNFAIEVPNDDAESFSLPPAGSSISVTRFDPSGIGGGGG